jgi:hypothetical protein
VATGSGVAVGVSVGVGVGLGSDCWAATGPETIANNAATAKTAGMTGRTCFAS